MLREITYQEDYRTGEDSLLKDFLRPSLDNSTVYWRAAGYFSSSAFEALGKPLREFVSRGGVMRLVTSVELSESDIAAIKDGLERRRAYEREINTLVEKILSEPVLDGSKALLELLAHGRLEIKIAVPSEGYGIYHEKIGLFFDGVDFVAFSGSSNESRRAFERNYESIDVFSSWIDQDRSNRKKVHFENLWSGVSKGVDVFDFPEAAAKKLIKAHQQKSIQKNVDPQPLWPHQQEALEIFLRQRRGILNMATGTGKTRTTLEIMRRLFQDGEICSTIIAADGNDLLDQWYEQLVARSADYGKAPRIYRQYSTYKEISNYRLDPEGAVLICSRENLKRGMQIGKVASKSLLVHDEVHKLGSPGNRENLKGLSAPFPWRLGLSATPEREYDADGNEFIDEHIGKVIFEFGLDRAIEEQILCPFNYFPLHYVPNEEDQERQKNVYKMVAARKAEGRPMSQEEIWIELAKVFKLSKAKLPLFREFVLSHPEVLKRCIIFVETMEYGEEVLELVHSFNSDFHTYYYGQDASTLQDFADNKLNCLITCHRLSEGIDVKSISSIILFSASRARLETIQRIGRSLRIDPDNQNKIANVVDFIRVSASTEQTNADLEREAWLGALAVIR